MSILPARDQDADEGFQGLLNRMMQTPTLDKLHALASNFKLSEEFIEDERRFEAKHDAYWAARAADSDDGEEVAA